MVTDSGTSSRSLFPFLSIDMRSKYADHCDKFEKYLYYSIIDAKQSHIVSIDNGFPDDGLERNWQKML